MTSCTITADTIDSESYYNLVQLCRLTGFANPIGAIKANRETWHVIKDDCGNIVRMAPAVNQVRYTPEPGSESAKELAAWYDSRTYTGD